MERVEGGGYGEPNRDGPGSTKMCRCGIVALFMGCIPCYRLGIPHRFATTLYKGTVAGVRESALMAIPTRDTMNTSATPKCFCVSRQKRDIRCVMLNRFCAFETFPNFVITSLKYNLRGYF